MPHLFDTENLMPLVSVIIATHNRAALLPVAVRSILSQTLRDFELIIIDDASSDDTPRVIGELMKTDERIHFIRSDENIGPDAARNLGILQAQGEYIAIMDDDDFSRPDRLQKEVEVLRANPEIGLVFSAVRMMDSSLQMEYVIIPDILMKGEYPTEPGDVFTLIYLHGSKIPNPTIMVRKSIFQQFPYPTDQIGGQDMCLFLRLAASGVRFHGIPECLVDMRRGADHFRISKTNDEYYRKIRSTLRSTREWVRDNGIHQFDHLYTRAISNQVTREALKKPGFLGFKRGILAIWIDPLNKFAWQTTWSFFKLLVNKKLFNR